MATYSTLSHIARGQPLPQADLKVTWSCARCGAVLEQAEVARDEGYYEAEIHFWPVCPSCEPEAVRDAP